MRPAGLVEQLAQAGGDLGPDGGEVGGFAGIGGEVEEFEGLRQVVLEVEAHRLPVAGAEGLFTALFMKFPIQGGVLRLQRAAMPPMLTLDERVVRQDCLCYLMERLPLPA